MASPGDIVFAHGASVPGLRFHNRAEVARMVRQIGLVALSVYQYRIFTQSQEQQEELRSAARVGIAIPSRGAKPEEGRAAAWPRAIRRAARRYWCFLRLQR